MKQNLTEIVAILDRSGSMTDLIEDTIGGFNTFVEKQKEEDGEANLTLVLFDDKYDVLYEDKDIQKSEKLTNKDYYARGMTALLDAVGKTINSVGGRLSSLDEKDRPKKVIFLITTDGFENASKEFTSDVIKEMVKLQEEKYSWEFIFTGANIDSFASGAAMGYAAVNTANFVATSDGINTLYSALSSRVSDTRKGVGGQSMVDYMKDAEDEVEDNA